MKRECFPHSFYYIADDIICSNVLIFINQYREELTYIILKIRIYFYFLLFLRLQILVWKQRRFEFSQVKPDNVKLLRTNFEISLNSSYQINEATFNDNWGYVGNMVRNSSETFCCFCVKRISVKETIWLVLSKYKIDVARRRASIEFFALWLHLKQRYC